MEKPKNEEKPVTTSYFTWLSRAGESLPVLGQGFLHSFLAVKSWLKYKVTQDTDDLYSAGIHSLAAGSCFCAGFGKVLGKPKATEPCPVQVKRSDGR